MERPEGVGGLSLPNLCRYYWAANFNAISLWLTEWNDRIPVWLQIEKATSSPHSLPALLCEPLPWCDRGSGGRAGRPMIGGSAVQSASWVIVVVSLGKTLHPPCLV